MRRLLALLALVLAATPVGAASAAAPELASWWYEPQQLPEARLPSPPNVPAGGLLVQHLAAAANPSLADVVPAGALSGTVAYGAVHTTTTPGSRGTLVLRTAAGSTALTAELRACATTSAWNAEDGAGPWFSRPTYDEPCAAGAVSGDGTSVTFPLAAELTKDGVLDVAIVPAAGATPFSVVFAPPDDRSIDLHGGSDDASGGYVVGPPPVFPGSVAVGSAPTTTAPTAEPRSTAIVPMVVQAATAPVRDPKLALLLLAGVAATWLALSRRRTRPPRSLLGPTVGT
ncbi:MAG: hypothetical protein JWN67_2682 [Actinomycetia bacterium]|nr:hypothetical protein [Actinomycetes bacterium]